MADIASDNLERFVRAVHRRWVAVRLAERVGLGALGGCAVALPLVGILLWRGERAMPSALALLAVGATVGLVAGLFRPPSRVSAALEADRQLSLADLLTTALLVRQRAGGDGWSATVVALADAQARRLKPGAVVLNRLGARAWGGIGLSVALLLTLTTLSAEPSLSHAGPRATVSGGAPLATNQPARPRVMPPRIPNAGAQGPSAQARGPGERDASLSNPPSPAGEEPSAHSARSPDSSASSSVAGAGEGSGRTPDARIAPLPSQADRTLPPRPSPSTGADSGAGSGRPAEGAGERDAARIGGLAGQRSQPITPPWVSSDWHADQRFAREALEAGAVPDRYRDVVRAYFQLEPAHEPR